LSRTRWGSITRQGDSGMFEPINLRELFVVWVDAVFRHRAREYQRDATDNELIDDTLIVITRRIP
jgi:hypothetical protein